MRTEDACGTIETHPADGGCELSLTHEMKLEWAEYAQRTAAGWTMILDRLAAARRPQE